jgi:hypothetical protein
MCRVCGAWNAFHFLGLFWLVIFGFGFLPGRNLFVFRIYKNMMQVVEVARSF